MSVLIIEGPDGAGKTTLIEKIKKTKERVIVHHHGAYHGTSIISDQYLQSLHLGQFRDVVMDRSWLAEPIYGQVMRGGENRLSAREVEFMESVAKTSANASIVLCLPPFDCCANAWNSRRENEYPQEPAQLRAIYDAYQAAFPKWGLRKYFYDWTLDPDGVHVESFVDAMIFD